MNHHAEKRCNLRQMTDNLLHFTMPSDADSNVISVRLQRKITEVRASKP
ncbi:Uncharacterised protein [Segatella oris]|uniref:Uncharacterized protein n=1 Tax=Segatella oris TaxID=28135 RepID=A0A448L3S0_9BACT|nr:Uncharacterised protein [Segatella oris]